MKCRELRDLIPDYVAGQLSPEALERFEAHRVECDDCRAEVEEAESVWMSLGELPESDPGPGLRSRFYAMLEEEKRRAGKHWLERVDDWLQAWWPRRPAVQMAMVVAFLAVGLAAGSRIETGPRGDGEVAQLRDEVQQMHNMVSLSLLGQNSSSERLRGVNWSARVAEPSDILLSTLTNTLNSDTNENVRLAAVDALGLFRDEPGVVDALAHAISQEASPTVQIALIDLLIEIQEKEALEALRNFVKMQNIIPPVKEHAQSRISDVM